MIQSKKDIKCFDLEARIKKAITQVDGFKHATEPAKREMYDLLISIRDDLIKWNDEIEIPEFMRETR